MCESKKLTKLGIDYRPCRPSCVGGLVYRWRLQHLILGLLGAIHGNVSRHLLITFVLLYALTFPNFLFVADE